MDILKVVSGIPLFQGLDPGRLKGVASIAVPKSFERGEMIFSQGDLGRGFFVIVRGRVRVYKLSAEGKEQILHFWGPGELFGEVPVFAGGCYPAHAEAAEAVACLYFPRAGLLELVRRDPDLALGLLAVLAERLHRFSGLIEDLSLKDVPARLAAYLLELEQEQGGEEGLLTLEIPKGQLASLLGTIPETLSRILARMAREGFVETGAGRQIRLLDQAGLADIARGRRKLN